MHSPVSTFLLTLIHSLTVLSGKCQKCPGKMHITLNVHLSMPTYHKQHLRMQGSNWYRIERVQILNFKKEASIRTNFSGIKKRQRLKSGAGIAIRAYKQNKVQVNKSIQNTLLFHYNAKKIKSHESQNA